MALLLCAFGCATPSREAREPQAATRGGLTLGTYNVRWLREPERLRGDFAALAHVDVWCLQEVRIGDADAGAVPRLLSLLPPGPWHVELARVNRLREIDSDDWECQAIISRFPLGDAASWPLDDRGAKRRVALAATVRTPNGPLLVVATDHAPSLFAWQDGNTRQLRELARRLGGTTGRAVVAGDFNCAGNLFRGYGNGEHLRRVAAELASVAFADATPAGMTYRDGLVSGRLDLLYTRGMKPSSSSVATAARGSDHRPVWCTFR